MNQGFFRGLLNQIKTTSNDYVEASKVAIKPQQRGELTKPELIFMMLRAKHHLAGDIIKKLADFKMDEVTMHTVATSNIFKKASLVFVSVILKPHSFDPFLMFQEFHVKKQPPHGYAPGVYDLDPHNMGYNFFTINGRCFPYTTPLEVCTGENVLIRLSNAMENVHPIHLHSHQCNRF